MGESTARWVSVRRHEKMIILGRLHNNCHLQNKVIEHHLTPLRQEKTEISLINKTLRLHVLKIWAKTVQKLILSSGI